jgi:MFS family permease
VPETAAALRADRELWRDADFARLFAAATVSNFGSMITALALPLLAIRTLAASPAELGALRTFGLLPGIAFGLLAGAGLDRLRRRPVLVASDAARAALYAAVGLMGALGALRMEQLYAVAFAAGALGFVFHVARDAYLPSVVGRSALVGANARLRGGKAATEGAGFAAGGWLVQLLGAPSALLVDASTFAASAALLGRIRKPEAPPPPRPEGRGPREALRDVAAGLRYVAADPTLRRLALAAALLAASWQVTGVVYLLFLDALGFDPGWLGLVFATGSLSSVLGAAAAGPLGRRLGARHAMWTGVGTLGLGALLVPLVQGPGPLGISLLVAQQLADGGEVVFDVHQTSVRQAAVPAELRGRVAGSIAFLGQVAMLAGSVLGGLLGSTVGPRATLVVGALGVLLAAPVVAVGPGLRRAGER